MNFFRSFIAICTALSLLLVPHAAIYAQSNLPNLGDDSGMTLGAERALGDQIAREIYRDREYVSDPVLDDYIRKILRPLFDQAKANGNLSPEMESQFAWQMFLIRDKSINAFALPGGYFGVHLGLIALSETPDSFASVLAHEITHVTQRHISRGISKENAQAPLLMASMLVGLLAMRSNPQAASAAMATGQAATIQGQLNFSRDFEREADRLGFALMQPAGYNPQGFVDMFDMLGKSARLSDNGSFPYLRSHPLTTERVADMRTRISSNQTIQPQLNALLLHKVMAARAGVLADLTVDAQKVFIQQGLAAQAMESEQARLTTLYAAALSAWQTKDAVQARKFYGQLHALTSIRTPPAVLDLVRWLGAELQIQGLTPKLDLMSTSRIEALYAAQQMLNQANPSAEELKTVTSRLQDWTSTHPKDVDAWSFLARAQLMQNQRVRAAMSTAEGLRAQQDDAAALAQYQTAQNLIRQGIGADAIDAAIVDSKVRELQRIAAEAQRKPGR